MTELGHGGVRDFEGEANGITFKIQYDDRRHATLTSARDASGDPLILTQQEIDRLIDIADAVIRSGGNG